VRKPNKTSYQACVSFFSKLSVTVCYLSSIFPCIASLVNPERKAKRLPSPFLAGWVKSIGRDVWHLRSHPSLRPPANRVLATGLGFSRSITSRSEIPLTTRSVGLTTIVASPDAPQSRATTHKAHQGRNRNYGDFLANTLESDNRSEVRLTY
jgi:hypothetical protein